MREDNGYANGRDIPKPWVPDIVDSASGQSREVPADEASTTSVTGVVFEKRMIKPGTLYIALRVAVGNTDGSKVVDVLLTPPSDALRAARDFKHTIKFGDKCCCAGAMHDAAVHTLVLTQEDRCKVRTVPPAQFVLHCADISVVGHCDDSSKATINICKQTNGIKYWCDVCKCGLGERLSFEKHKVGKRHLANTHEKVQVWEKFCSQAPTWTAGTDATSPDVTETWDDSEIGTFPMGTTRLDQHVMVGHLSASLKARFWRYLNDRFGAHSPEIGTIFHEIGIIAPECLRVKELFESIEAFIVISKFIVMAKAMGHNVDRIFDVACGHGLVGILLAYRFPAAEVVCIDRERRSAFNNFYAAWGAKGEKTEGCDHPLHNITFIEDDFTSIGPQITETSCVVAMHACNEANALAVEMARAKNALWAAMPCCVAHGIYLPICAVSLDDEARHAFMCGALACKYNAQLVKEIDRKITNRHIVICGGRDQVLTGHAKPGVVAHAKPA